MHPENFLDEIYHILDTFCDNVKTLSNRGKSDAQYQQDRHTAAQSLIKVFKQIRQEEVGTLYTVVDKWTEERIAADPDDREAFQSGAWAAKAFIAYFWAQGEE